MDELKKQEIKNKIRELIGIYTDKVRMVQDIVTSYIEQHNEHYRLDDIYYEILPEVEAEILAEQPVVLNPIWFDKACSQRIHLSDEGVKNIAIDALSLIQYVQANGLTIETVQGGANVYVNFILPEHQAIFEGFGGVVEANPYKSTTELSEMTVALLNEYYESLGVAIEDWSNKLKAEKIEALTTLIYG